MVYFNKGMCAVLFFLFLHWSNLIYLNLPKVDMVIEEVALDKYGPSYTHRIQTYCGEFVKSVQLARPKGLGPVNLLGIQLGRS